MENQKYRVIAHCWIPVLDTPQKQHRYQFHDQVYASLIEAEHQAEILLEDKITGEFISIQILEVN